MLNRYLMTKRERTPDIDDRPPPPDCYSVSGRASKLNPTNEETGRLQNLPAVVFICRVFYR